MVSAVDFDPGDAAGVNEGAIGDVRVREKQAKTGTACRKTTRGNETKKEGKKR